MTWTSEGAALRPVVSDHDSSIACNLSTLPAFLGGSQAVVNKQSHHLTDMHGGTAGRLSHRYISRKTWKTRDVHIHMLTYEVLYEQEALVSRQRLPHRSSVVAAAAAWTHTTSHNRKLPDKARADG
jgi:hypothetical protein